MWEIEREVTPYCSCARIGWVLQHHIPILILLFFYRVDGCPTSTCLWEFKMTLQIFITWQLANLRGFEIRQDLNLTRGNMTSTQLQ